MLYEGIVVAQVDRCNLCTLVKLVAAMLYSSQHCL